MFIYSFICQFCQLTIVGFSTIVVNQSQSLEYYLKLLVVAARPRPGTVDWSGTPALVHFLMKDCTHFLIIAPSEKICNKSTNVYHINYLDLLCNYDFFA